MKNSEQPAHPLEAFKDPNRGHGEPDRSHPAYMGLTKREYFAGLAMQALLSNSDTCDSEHLYENCVRNADELLKQLEK